MLQSILKVARAVIRVYGSPGAGVVVSSGPDSVLDFYRMSNVRLPLEDASARRPDAKTIWVWGGGTAAHGASYRPAPVSDVTASRCG